MQIDSDVMKYVYKLSMAYDDAEARGNMTVTIYSPYWIVNKTGLVLLYRDVCAI